MSEGFGMSAIDLIIVESPHMSTLNARRVRRFDTGRDKDMSDSPVGVASVETGIFADRLQAEGFQPSLPPGVRPAGSDGVSSDSVQNRSVGATVTPRQSEYEVRYRITTDRQAPAMSMSAAQNLVDGCKALSEEAWGLSSKASSKCSDWPALGLSVRDAAADLLRLAEAGPESLIEEDRTYNELARDFEFSAPTLQDEPMTSSIMLSRRHVWSAMGIPMGLPYKLSLMAPSDRIGLLWFTVWLADSVVPRRSRSESPALRSGRETYGFVLPQSDPRTWAMVVKSLPCFKHAPVLDLTLSAMGSEWREWSEQVLEVMLDEVAGVVRADPFWSHPGISPTKTWSVVMSRAAEYDKQVNASLSRVF